jgi:coenzyme F420-0:L-glutamate ligase / coenzyme F420-1:gamma-L-glutamate ligase
VTAPLILTALPGLPLVQAGDDLVALIEAGLRSANLQLQHGDVLVIAQKIVSKAEGRRIRLADVQPSTRALELASETSKDSRLVELILNESRAILRTRPGLIIVEHRLGFVCANAGIDRSNVEGGHHPQDEWVLLLPADPDGTCGRLKAELEARWTCDIGVLIIDSHGRAWRMGTVGVAIGAAGLPALLDLRGRPDLYGDPLQITQLGLADEIAGAASLLMGQADEGRPVIHLRGLPYPLQPGAARQLVRPPGEDLFR